MFKNQIVWMDGPNENILIHIYNTFKYICVKYIMCYTYL